MATPMIRTIKSLGYDIDILVNTSLGHHGEEIFYGWNAVDLVFTNIKQINADRYDMIIYTYWYLVQAKTMKISNTEHSRSILPGHCDFSKKSEIELNMDMARELGYEGKTPNTYAGYSNRTFNIPQNTIALCPGCTKNSRIRLWYKFDQIAKELNCPIALVGSKSDFVPDYNWDGIETHDFIGKLSLIDTAALLRQCGILITTDGGLMHWANAIGVKTFAIWGYTSQFKSKPQGVIAISKNLDCQKDCYMRGNYVGCKYPECTKDLEVDEVYKKIMENWRKK